MDDQKQQLIEKLKGANNILVTVSANPSVDQLAACIGLTLMLNKLDKHATAVFSGAVPSTLEFLKPEDTLEQNTDSLRDFIIALDKSKADKLRYKVEDKVVKIFITPYRTSISQDDLEFSQGDFNVDVVVALGVREQRDLDQAITAHGRILHDAVVASVNTTPDGGLGSINWHNPASSSLSEMVEGLGSGFDKPLLDEQIATALLTGIVAETDRFSNEKTSANTMKVSAELMAAGANQQLVANKLQEQQAISPEQGSQNPGQGGNGSGQPSAGANPSGSQPPPASDNGTLEIAHDRPQFDLGQDLASSQPPVDQPEASAEADIDELLKQINQPPAESPVSETPLADGSSRPLDMQPPSLGGTLTANTQPEGLDPAIDPLSLPAVEEHQPILKRDKPEQSAPVLPSEPSVPPPSPPEPPQSSPEPSPAQPPVENTDESNETQTLTDIEESVHSPHAPEVSHLDSARSAVEEALNSGPSTDLPKPDADLGALPLGGDLHPEAPAAPSEKADTPPPSHEVHIDEDGNFHPTPPQSLPTPPAAAAHEPAPGENVSPASRPLDMPLPTFTPPSPSAQPPADTTSPPPSPPPFVPPPFPGPNDQS